MEGTPFGRYRLIELLGRGGMGEVWRAHDTVTDRVVAIKVLPAHLSEDEDFQRRFRREAHAAARLGTPHVVPIHDYGEIDGRLFVSMRLIEGRDLDTVLADGALEPARAVRIIDQVARALHAAHKVGLIHRDIKPSNILLDDDDFAYLIDFGIARAADETRMTKSGHMIGTFAYIAPERLDPQTQEDARADIYSLACVLYEALTGEPPFAGTTTAHLIAAHLNTPPPRPSTTQPDVPAQFDAVIAKGMAKGPDQRYSTTIELADAARDAITVPIRQPTPSPAPQQPPPEPYDTRPQSPPSPWTPAAAQLGPESPTYFSPQFASPAPQDQRTLSPMPLRPGPHTAPRQPWWRRLAIVIPAALVTVAVIAAILITVTTSQQHRDVQVPDVTGQLSADAIAALQNLGFTTRTQQKPDSSVPPDHVISTEPKGNDTAKVGSEVTINVSTGPEQREVPDVSTLSYTDAVTKLKAAGFSKFKQVNSPSTPELLGRVIGTNPPNNQMTAITNVITVVVGSGP
jgi:serine/threonine protein kinase